MKSSISRLTRSFRHSLVRIIAPTLYRNYKISSPMPRGMVQEVKKMFADKPLTGVEIGVFSGEHAQSILKNLNIKKLYLVDPYLSYTHGVEKGYSSKQMNKAFREAITRLKPYQNKVEWIQKTSKDAVTEVPENIDFVYIDGNHTYEFVREDIHLYFPKIKNGGVLGGHDFDMPWIGLAKAVIEFAAEEGLEVYGRRPSDWFVIKGSQKNDSST